MKDGWCYVLVLMLAGCAGKSVSSGPGGTGSEPAQTETELCVSLCGKAKQCPNAAASTASIDCNDFCVAYENVARKGGCASSLQSYFSCFQQGDVCGDATSCVSQSDAIGQCLGTYCTANQNDADCVALLSNFSN